MTHTNESKTQTGDVLLFDRAGCRYPGSGKDALRDVTLQIREGEFVFLTGASGSGKSTLLRLCTLETPLTAGTLHVLGRDVSTIRKRRRYEIRRKVGVIFQDYRLLDERSAWFNVAFALHAVGYPKRDLHDRVDESLELVGLSPLAHEPVRTLSGGEQQRVAIARAVAPKPSLLLADEPTGNLDPVNATAIFDLLASLPRTGATVLVATHDLGAVRRLGKRTIELRNATILADRRAASADAVPA